MGWFSRFFAGDPQKRDPSSDFWYGPVGAMTAAGMAVTPREALRIPAVVDALSAYALPIAHLPGKVFRRLKNGDKEPADDHPASRLLAAPADGWSRFEWRGHLQWHLGLHSNAYCEIVPGPLGAIEQLRPLHPDLVSPEWRDGAIWYRVSERGRQRWLRQDEILHLRWLPVSPDGLTGISRVDLDADTIGHALAVQDYGARFFRNDGQSGGIITHPHKLGPEDRANLARAWGAARSGANAHKAAVLDGGATYDRATLDNQKSQFLETRKDLAIEIARLWNLPPHKIRSLDKASFSNIEQQSIEFVTDSMVPMVSLWEDKLNADIVGPLSGMAAGEFFFEFNLDGLLRGDIKSRYEAFGIGRQWGWLSVNDIRRLDNMNSIAGGDVYLQPVNMVPADSPAARGQPVSSPPAAPGDRQPQGGNVAILPTNR